MRDLSRHTTASHPHDTLLQAEVRTQHAPLCPHVLTHARAHALSELTQQSELLTAVMLLREGTLLVLVGAAPSES